MCRDRHGLRVGGMARGGMAWHEACPSPAVQACPLRYFSATYFCSAPLNMISTSLSVCLFSFELCFTRKDKSGRHQAVQGFTSLFLDGQEVRACPAGHALNPQESACVSPHPAYLQILGILTDSWHFNRFSAYLQVQCDQHWTDFVVPLENM